MVLKVGYEKSGADVTKEKTVMKRLKVDIFIAKKGGCRETERGGEKGGKTADSLSGGD
jgi:hypothetical protein